MGFFMIRSPSIHPAFPINPVLHRTHTCTLGRRGLIFVTGLNLHPRQNMIFTGLIKKVQYQGLHGTVVPTVAYTLTAAKPS